MSAMKREDRAKQFMPFAALKGYDEAIARAGRTAEPRRELSEDELERLNRKLQELQPGDEIVVCCYDVDRYGDFAGTLQRVDPLKHALQIDGRWIRVKDILDIR